MHLIRDLFVMFAAAKLLGEVFERVRQPPVVGELLAGVLIGPHLLGWVGLGDAQDALAQIGIVVLLFTVGLGAHVTELRSVAGRAAVVSAAGMIAAFGAGWGTTLALGHGAEEALFVGAALVATSAGIAGRVLRDTGASRSRPAQVILGASVLDDVLGLAVLAVVVGTASGAVSTGSVLLTVGEAAAFVTIVAVMGPRLARRHAGLLDRPRLPRAPLVLALVLCFGLSALAEAIGLAALVGAFLAGLVLSETRDEYRLEREMAPIAEFLVPFFFVVTGARLDLGVFREGSVVALTIALAVAAVASKLVACWLAARPLGRREALTVGVGMVPRGEVGILVASIGLSLGVVSPAIYAAVIGTAIATTVAAPPFLTALLRTPPERAEPGGEAPDP